MRQYLVILVALSFTACSANLMGASASQDGNVSGGGQSVGGGGNGSGISSLGSTESLLIGGPGVDTSKFFPPVGQDCGTTLGAGTVPNIAPLAFKNECAGCHGPDGTGHGNFPNIHVPMDVNSFKTTVRNGLSGSAGTMPSFSTKWLNDNDLNRVYAYLTSSAIFETNTCTPVAPMGDADINTAMTQGLAAWRKSGASDPNGIFSGAACVNCHGPDPMELAYMGYADGDILRRAQIHLAQADYNNIIDMVHALRVKYSIPLRDPMVARPFQPGGQVLAGATAADRDAAFGVELRSLNLRIMSSPLASVADAATAEKQLWGINRHGLQIPIPFNRLTEDQFHNPANYVPGCAIDIDLCDDHGTISDWISVAPHMPASASDQNKMFAAADAYLASPNDALLGKLLGSLPSDNTMPGTYSNGYARGIDGNKYPAIQFASHCMRLEVMGLPGCYDKGLAPYPNLDSGIWGMGTIANLFGTDYEKYDTCNTDWTGCNSSGGLIDWPAHLLADMTPHSKLSHHFQRLRHVWMDLWWTHFDPTLLVTGDPTTWQDEYFSRSIFWSNNNDNDNEGARDANNVQVVNPTYSIYNVYQILQHNVVLLNTPQDPNHIFSCDKIPFNHPDLGRFDCTPVEMRSGYFPELTNFAEGKNFYNTNTMQLLYQPKDARKADYQMLAGNLHRLFLYKLIGELQTNNYMCHPEIEQLRIARAKTFLAQPEIVAASGAADTAMFATLANLMASSVKNCPAAPFAAP